jgi:hypothetical protein
MSKLLLKTIVIGAICALCTQLALAQYVWINENGVKHYSDKPPPSGTNKNKIIKGLQAQPITSKAASSSNNTDGNATPNVNSNVNQDPNKPAETPRQLMQKKIAAQEEEFAKYKKSRDEEEKKEQEEREQKLEKEKNCNRALSYKQSLEMAGSISIVNKKGEREFLSDENRKKELEDAQKVLKECN